MIEELVSRAFLTRNLAHVEHFKTRSYSAHVALGAFYDDLIEAIDGLVEAYIGSFGELGDIPEAEKVAFSVDHLREEADWIEVNRKEISGGSDAIGNLVDAVTGVYLKAAFMLTQFNAE